MIPIDIQVTRSNVKVKGQAYSSYVGEGGISVLQTAIFWNKIEIKKQYLSKIIVANMRISNDSY